LYLPIQTNVSDFSDSLEPEYLFKLFCLSIIFIAKQYNLKIAKSGKLKQRLEPQSTPHQLNCVSEDHRENNAKSGKEIRLMTKNEIEQN